MGSYLDAYASAGQQSERRGKIVKRVALSVLAAAVVVTVAYFGLRTWSQEHVINQFLEDLQRKDYQSAYKLWGCTPETPCKDYSSDKFNEDWGSSSPYSNAAALKIEHVDYCDTGVVFNLTYPKQEELGLWVDRSTNVIGFAPWTRCPGRHLQLGEFFKTLFSKS
jgi:CDP-glycerol glycerophosphotransferase (TagB/SpsB family)